jgi:nucleoside-diphosphate-sugar epimerase
MTYRAVVTGGAGFIGAYLVKRLVRLGCSVTCFDNLARGDLARLGEVLDDIRTVQGDVRDADAVVQAVDGADVVFHLAAINGTENFYRAPELVLDVGLRGILAVVEACRRCGVPDLVVASSAEVYQRADCIPTAEDVPLMLPDSLNPRYSYGGSKIVSELVAFNYGRDHFRKVQVFRPHNVYGPDMGWKHVIPQFIDRALEARDTGRPCFEIQGDGSETRAFAYVEDVVEGITTMYAHGGNREVFHIGNDREVAVRDLALLVGDAVGARLDVVPGPAPAGQTDRRCPDIGKMRSLGYAPKVDLEEGLALTAAWYEANRRNVPQSALM